MECKVGQLLEHIEYPDDLRRLPADKLEEVCAELRQYIIDVLAENPGHLGASLGTVELTVALHYVFQTPYDRIVWDVGHQAYGHKILTGRKDRGAFLELYLCGDGIVGRLRFEGGERQACDCRDRRWSDDRRAGF